MIVFLPWDTDFFGYKVGRLSMPPGLFDQFGNLLAQARQEGYRLVYISVPDPDALDPGSQKKLDRLLQSHGLQLMHDRGIIDLPVPEPPLTIPERINEWEGRGDRDRLSELNLMTGEYSRFKRDPAFVRGEYARLYQHWLDQGLVLDPDHKVYLAQQANKIIGFLSLSKKDGYVSMDLMAIDPLFRHQGLAFDLVQAARYWTGQLGLDRIRGTIQRDNLPAMNLYRKIGFRVLSPEFIYHYWLNQPGQEPALP